MLHTKASRAIKTMCSNHRIKVFSAAFLVFFITLLVYLPALQNGFVNWDDPAHVYENPNIRTVDSNSFKWMFSFQETIWAPLTRLSHILNYAVWELDPMGHHLTNIVLHGLNAFLVVLVVVRLMESFKYSDLYVEQSNTEFDSGRAIITGAVAGIFFGIHPLHVESVAWITERKDVLSAFFFLLSILFYLRYAQEGKSQPGNGSTRKAPEKLRIGTGSPRDYGLSLLFFIMALLSKPVAVTLPAVLLILDVYPLKRLRSKNGFRHSAKVIVEKAPYFLSSLAVTIITILSHKQMGAVLPVESYHDLINRLLIAFRSIGFYIYKIVLPVNLAPFYPYPKHISLLRPDFLIPVVLVPGITILCIYLWKKQKIWLSVWTYFVLTLLPVLGMVQIGHYAAADRYTYLPSLGPFILIGLGTAELMLRYDSGKRYLKKSFILIFIFVLVLSAVLTVKQIGIWKDSLTLWGSEIRVFPDNALAYYFRGNAYSDLGNYKRAVDDYNKAIEINPGFAKAYNNRGNAYSDLGNYQRAVDDYSYAIKLDQKFAVAYGSRGFAFANFGDNKRAIDDYNKAIKLEPGLDLAYYNRANAFYDSGDYQKAIADYSMSIELNPGYAAYNNRGRAYTNIGLYNRAINDFNASIAMSIKSPVIYYNRGRVYEIMNKQAEADRDFKIAAGLGSLKAQRRLKALGIDW